MANAVRASTFGCTKGFFKIHISTNEISFAKKPSTVT